MAVLHYKLSHTRIMRKVIITILSILATLLIILFSEGLLESRELDIPIQFSRPDLAPHPPLRGVLQYYGDTDSIITPLQVGEWIKNKQKKIVHGGIKKEEGENVLFTTCEMIVVNDNSEGILAVKAYLDEIEYFERGITYLLVEYDLIYMDGKIDRFVYNSSSNRYRLQKN